MTSPAPNDFVQTDVDWEFTVVSTDLDKIAARDAGRRGKPRGLVHDDKEANLRVRAFEWGEIIDRRGSSATP